MKQARRLLMEIVRPSAHTSSLLGLIPLSPLSPPPQNTVLLLGFYSDPVFPPQLGLHFFQEVFTLSNAKDSFLGPSAFVVW